MRFPGLKNILKIHLQLQLEARLTQLTQHATHESKTKYTLLYAKGHSAQPKSMRVMPLCLWGV